MPIKSVAIVGAGIAGLTAALSFARYGIDCDIIEQAGELTEVGAGLQLSPNAARILDTLGVLPDIEARWTEPLSVELASGNEAREIWTPRPTTSASSGEVRQAATNQRIDFHIQERVPSPNAPAAAIGMVATRIRSAASRTSMMSR